MEYRGRTIKDEVCVERFIELHNQHSNSVDLYTSDLLGFLEKIKNKEKEGGADGKINNVKINITADGSHDAYDGSITGSYAEICLSWTEPETAYEKKTRIDREKLKIDTDIEREKRRNSFMEKEERLRIEKAIDLLKQHGIEIKTKQND